MRRLTARYSLVMACFWSGLAVLSNYASAYMLSHGLNNTQIGLMIAAAALLSAAVQPLVAAYADTPRSPSVKAILLAMGGLYLAFTLLVALLAEQRAAVMTVAYALALMLSQSMLPLNNALGTISISKGNDLNFGMARGIGSLVYAVVSLVMGRAIALRGTFLIPLVSIGLYGFYALSLLLFPFEKTVLPVSRTGGRGFLQKYPGFMTVLLGAVFLYISHGFIHSFAYQIITSKGGDSGSLGVAYAIAALMELPLMFCFTRLLRRISAGKWLVVGGFAFVVKSAVTLLAAGVIGFYCAQTLQIASYAVITIASVYYVNDIMEPQDAVKGQTFFVMTSTIGSVFASAFGGWLLDARGVPALLAAAIAFAAAGALVVWRGVGKTACTR